MFLHIKYLINYYIFNVHFIVTYPMIGAPDILTALNINRNLELNMDNRSNFMKVLYDFSDITI
ncbi:MAG: hypothetical protein COB49_12705 [Alphaproteobacteria bacterium]|nr:MAG: hypothetical protein COB49_12705 [Alphaproteobacteria bacterium]